MKPQDAIGERGRRTIVSDEHDRTSGVGGATQQVEHLRARFLVEVSGRLVGEHERGVVDERARDCEPLLLSAGERRRQPACDVREPEPREEFARTWRRFDPVACQLRGQEDVLDSAQLGQQVEGLEDEADVAPANGGQPSLVELVQARAAELDRPGIGAIEAAEQMQEGRLPRAGASDDGNELAARNVQIGAVEHADSGASFAVRLDEPACVHERPHAARIGTVFRRRSLGVRGPRGLDFSLYSEPHHSGKGGAMTAIDELLENATRYAEDFDKGELPLPPAKRVAVLACMDARLDPNALLGLSEGDAHVIRNAGGVVTDDEIRSLAISQRLLGTEEIMLIHHTDCGMLTFGDDEFRRQVQVDTGIKPEWPAEAFDDLEADVRQSIARIKSSPFIPKKENVRGFVYEVESGRLREVT